MTELSISQSQIKNYKNFTTIRISGIVEESIVDGPGIRLVVFTQGCNHNCPECHNPHTHDFNGGYEIDIYEIIELAKNNPLLDGITLSGGEPFDQAENCSQLAALIKSMGLNVITYTGYTYEVLIQNINYMKLLEKTDLLIDGRFDISKKDLTLDFRGSSNQRIIDVIKSFENNNIYIARR